MKTSDSQANLLPALFAAKGEFPRIVKGKKGQAGHREFNYAPLDAITDAVDPVLRKHGLMVTQTTEGHSLVTRLEHVASGEWREGTMPLNAEHANMQSYGIEVTYRRRYAIPLLLGIVTEEDVDIKAKEKRGGRDFTDGDKPSGSVGKLSAESAGATISYERKSELDELALVMIEQHDAGRSLESSRLYYALEDNDEKAYLWGNLTANSKLRNIIKATSPHKAAA